MDKNKGLKFKSEEFRDIEVFARGSPKFWKAVMDKAVYGALFLYGIKEVIHPRAFPECRWQVLKALLDRDFQIGCLEGTMIQNPLYVPETDSRRVLELNAKSGEWVFYDHERPNKIRRTRRQTLRGVPVSFIPEDFKGHPPSRYTPLGAVVPMGMDIFCVEFPSIDFLLEQGAIVETTYEEAYGRLGLMDTHGDFLRVEGLSERLVYQITPKGNSLVHCEGYFGDKEPDTDEVKAVKRGKFEELLPDPV